MSCGQTNGIPQGSVLMDFIAEIVLGYIDTGLAKKLRENKVKNYKIIRYRDDYKIFTNNPIDGEKIVKCLSEILIEFGMRLNSQKTSFEDSVINGAIKKDKWGYILSELTEEQKSKKEDHVKREQANIQRLLLMIYNFGRKYPNSGQIKRLLNELLRRYGANLQILLDDKKEVLIGIIINIAYENPITYPKCITLISRLLSDNNEEYIKKIIEQIKAKFSNKINNDYLEIWMQRLSYKIDKDIKYDCELCKLVMKNANSTKDAIWNSAWVSDEVQTIIKEASIIDLIELDTMDPIIQLSEVNDFSYMYDY
jgi:hypothetical protein